MQITRTKWSLDSIDPIVLQEALISHGAGWLKIEVTGAHTRVFSPRQVPEGRNYLVVDGNNHFGWRVHNSNYFLGDLQKLFPSGVPKSKKTIGPSEIFGIPVNEILLESDSTGSCCNDCILERMELSTSENCDLLNNIISGSRQHCSDHDIHYIHKKKSNITTFAGYTKDQIKIVPGSNFNGNACNACPAGSPTSSCSKFQEWMGVPIGFCSDKKSHFEIIKGPFKPGGIVGPFNTGTVSICEKSPLSPEEEQNLKEIISKGITNIQIFHLVHTNEECKSPDLTIEHKLKDSEKIKFEIPGFESGKL